MTDGPGRAVPISRVFPRWYVAGAVSSIVVIAVSQVGQPAVVCFWGPVIGLTIRDRLDDARSRAVEGRDISRAALLGPAWLEPVLSLLLTSFAIGLSFLFGAVFDGLAAHVVWTGVTLCLASTLAYLLILLRGRRRTRRRETAADDVSASEVASN
ncbi:hypothetical protein IFT90_16115 [Frigoribacterium sp. CFBP 8766]|uniref:hypothetical protein n=1 Tax=Frigoribacterium sp. CFBP 8766 TaxID=2775273 RepID=UPI00178571D5|nr:hypothetical protein [Frigoribacterium sp. CFBP 8766]MBD8586083.1 hypothetical protein [Frigoribacterium sp. CFBP 8766]